MAGGNKVEGKSFFLSSKYRKYSTFLDQDENARSFYTVVVGVGTHKFGIVVDRLIGQKEIVIKPLGAYLKNIPGIAGSTILGDGRVIMIFDAGELLRLVQKESGQRVKVPGEARFINVD